jgi:hypothetical protein
MTHSQLIDDLVSWGQPTSPFMAYWTIHELTRYWVKRKDCTVCAVTHKSGVAENTSHSHTPASL